MHKTNVRKKINFMINKEISVKIQEAIPKGQRSDFVNKTLEEALLRQNRQKAGKEMDKLREQNKIKLTTEEIIKLKNYGRS